MSVSGIATETFGRAAKMGGPIVVAGGIFADVVAPLAPVALYITIFAATITVVSGIVWFFGYRRKFVAAMRDGKIDADEARELASTNRWSILFAFSFIATVIMGVVTVAGAAMSEDNRGALASNIPGLQKLQDDLFDLKKDVKEIKKDTEKIAKDTEKISKTTEKVSKDTEKISKTTEKVSKDTEKISKDTGEIKETLASIAKSFENLQGKGGILPNPKTPQEFYHNARLHELGSNYPAAKKAYIGYFKFRLEFVDPHERYARMLKNTEDIEEAREAYDYFLAGSKNPTVRMTRALLNPKGKRLSPLEALAEETPEFAPVWYHIAELYSPKKRPNQTLSDKESEKTALEKFRELDGKGKFARWFLDKSVAAERRESADQRWAALEMVGKASPVSMGTMQSNQGWSINFQIGDGGLQEIFYRMDGKGEFISTGHNPGITDPVTGKPFANLHVALEHLEPGNHEVEVKYRNRRGEMQGPFKMKFSTFTEIVKNRKHELGMGMGWVSYRIWDGKLLVYFTSLVSSRDALKEIRYSVDSDALDKKFPITPWTKPGRPEIRDDPTWIVVPHSTNYVTVKLLYLDKTESKMKKFVNRSDSIKMEELELSFCDDDKIKHIRDLVNLKDLNISDTKITDAGLASIAGLTKLEILNLSECESITDAGLAHLKGFTNLKELNLGDTKITNEGLVNLAGLKNLASLDLSECDGITGAGIPPLQSLTHLNLKQAKVNDAGMAKLAALTNLEELDLSHCRNYTDEGLASLKALVKLKKLNLKRTKAGSDAIKSLQEAMPGCKISR